ncbi:hypothetical protein [Citrobacter sp. Res13-Sevr-PEB04-36]|uniref:hypothetical protein n=1 Tax=Citrobacter sp. Res13-Sevr-PEB04-36 TaxID=2777960 RepID=UPI0018ACB58C|nr:hypothetical protein [Citrobacter sp. Res13-Sevr-PEB04-36]MCM7458882.1 hypothetical protein [Enterobacter hormaechei]
MTNFSNEHSSAQGLPLSEKGQTGLPAYGLSEDGFGKLARAKEACDLLQLLFSEYPYQGGSFSSHCTPGIAALMEYLRADLTDATRCCMQLDEGLFSYQGEA